MKLYNTLTRKKEDFVSIVPHHVLFYHCGPTVYWTQHIGNLRGLTMGDLVRRTFQFLGYSVTHVRNYTDVGHLVSDADEGEDKMEKGVKREGTTPDAIAQKYISQLEHDTKAINLLEPTYKPRATEYIQQMIQMIEALVVNGHAYVTDLAVYFDVTTFSSYAQLSRQHMDKLMEGAGKADVSDPRKKHAADFALWFFKAGVHANALQYWQSPFQSLLVRDGVGFPGWHIECSAMTKALLGATIDIHMGGVEHISVHHTNEIAQSESANNAPFVHYWLHNEHLLVDGKKMAKSEGTGFSLSEIQDHGYDPLVLRYFFLQAHYRSKQNFTWEALDASKNAYRDLLGRIQAFRTLSRAHTLGEAATDFKGRFTKAISDDLNVPQALAVVWEVIKSDIPDTEKKALIEDFDTVLGLELISQVETKIPENIVALCKKRDELRANRDYAGSDRVRDTILAAGYLIEDTPSGTTVKKR